MKQLIFTISLIMLCVSGTLLAQLTEQRKALDYARSIDSNDMKRHLFYLASDYLEGRETGTKGNERAARYAADFFSKLGYKAVDENANYFQEIPFTRFLPARYMLSVNGKEKEQFNDFVVMPFRQKPIVDSGIEQVYFAGYGIQDEGYSDFGNRNWEGKTLIIFESIPEEIGVMIRDSSRFDLKNRLATASEKGAKAIFVISDRFNPLASRARRYMMSGFLNLGEIEPDSLPLPPHAMISTDLGKQIVGSRYKKFIKAREELKTEGGLEGKPLKIPVDLILHWTPQLELIESSNVVAYLPGSHPTLKDEHIIISAHYDHLGERAEEVYNGADDNASGTTTLLELAETFSEARERGDTLARSLLFILMTGEEKGLLGSRYYADHPILPLDKAVANVNIDMVGRVDEKYSDSTNYIYVIGADRISQDLHDINEMANRNGPGLILDYKYNEEDDPNRYYYRSDHYNFAKKGIPAIFYFNGTHEDYHRLSDTADKIRFSHMDDRAELFFLTIWELAQRTERLKIDNSTK